MDPDLFWMLALGAGMIWAGALDVDRTMTRLVAPALAWWWCAAALAAQALWWAPPLPLAHPSGSSFRRLSQLLVTLVFCFGSAGIGHLVARGVKTLLAAVWFGALSRLVAAFLGAAAVLFFVYGLHHLSGMAHGAPFFNRTEFGRRLFFLFF